MHEVRVEDKNAEADEEDPAEQLRGTAGPSVSQSVLRKSYRDGMGEPSSSPITCASEATAKRSWYGTITWKNAKRATCTGPTARAGPGRVNPRMQLL